MPIPQEKEIRRVILDSVKSDNPHNLSIEDFLRITAEYFGEDIDTLPANKHALKPLVDGAIKYLKRHKLISNPLSNTYMITKFGAEILEKTTGVIDAKCLKSLSSESSPPEPKSIPAPVPTELESTEVGLPDEGEAQELPDETSISVQEAEHEALPDNDALREDTPDYEELLAPEPENDTLHDDDILPTETPDNTGNKALPDDIDMSLHDDDAFQEDIPEQVQEHDALSDNDALTTDTPDYTSNEALPDDIDMSLPDDDALQEDIPEQEPEHDALPDDDASQEDISEESESQELPDNIDMSDTQPESENIPEDEYTTDEVTEGEDIMPAEDLAPEDYSDGAVIQSPSIEDIIARHNSELADKVLMRVAGLSSETFEVLVIDLLSKMGYRAFQNARYTSDESDNGMIQGVILDTQNPTPIYIHASKLSPGQTIGRADIQDFVEALADKGGKGIFATTAEFSENAITYAQDERIMLIDGQKLAGLMIAHNFCVNVEKVIEVKNIDDDSFSDYES